MKLRVTVEVEIDEAALDKEYSDSKCADTLAAYRNEGSMPEETRRMLAMDALDRHHGMPKRCVKDWKIISNVLVPQANLDGIIHDKGGECCKQSTCRKHSGSGTLCGGRVHSQGVYGGMLDVCELCDPDAWHVHGVEEKSA